MFDSLRLTLSKYFIHWGVMLIPYKEAQDMMRIGITVGSEMILDSLHEEEGYGG